MDELNNALNAVKVICDEWNTLKQARSERGGWLFDYKLYELSAKCNDEDDFNIAASLIYEEWEEAARTAAGYAPQMWEYNKYFKHDNHHGSYFTFSEDIDGDNSLDFWANEVGLEWDVTTGKEWEFTPFEKAIHEVYGVTRFSSDRLTPETYNAEELKEITKHITVYTVPALRETLKERKEVIRVYDEIKARQCDYIEEVVA